MLPTTFWTWVIPSCPAGGELSVAIGSCADFPYVLGAHGYAQCMGVGGCGWPSSLSGSMIIFASFAFKNIAPNSASAADAATNLRIVQSVRIGPFRRMGHLSSSCQPRKKWPAARLTFKIMSDG